MPDKPSREPHLLYQTPNENAGSAGKPADPGEIRRPPAVGGRHGAYRTISSTGRRGVGSSGGPYPRRSKIWG